MDRTITGCVVCPFHKYYGYEDRESCQIVNKEIPNLYLVPDFCPLRTESITIKLKDNVH